MRGRANVLGLMLVLSGLWLMPRQSGCEVPEWMTAMHRPSKKKRKQFARSEPRRPLVPVSCRLQKVDRRHASLTPCSPPHCSVLSHRSAPERQDIVQLPKFVKDKAHKRRQMIADRKKRHQKP